MDKKTFSLALGIGVVILCIFLFLMLFQRAPSVSTGGEESQMKVKFYAVDREKADKGDFVGAVELKDGKLVIDTADDKLIKILESPYPAMSGEVKDGKHISKFVTYESGTIPHLRAIVLECWRFGYIAEIEKEE